MVLNHAIHPKIRHNLFQVMSRLVMIWVLISSGCQPAPPEPIESDSEHIKKTEFMGFLLPVYSTAVEQLIYAESRIADAREKEAALKLVLSRFPQEKKTCALTRLDLAYLALAPDYRLADRSACRQALAQYHQIIRTYADLPGICAKACWYMGWIYTDLLDDINSGMVMYQQVADRYPSERVVMESPTSWLKLMYPEKPGKAFRAHERQHYSWAALALLEMVKKNEDLTQRRHALVKLWTLKPAGPVTGLALLSALKSPSFNTDKTVQQLTARYIRQNSVNKVLIQDIRTALAQIKSGDFAK